MKNFNLANEVIEIICNENINWKAIVIELAKRNPDLLYKIVKGDAEEEFKSRIYNLYTNNGRGKFHCSKMVRDKYGFGLKEAIEYVNNLIEEYENINDTKAQ